MPLDPQAKQVLDLINSAPGFDLEADPAQGRAVEPIASLAAAAA